MRTPNSSESAFSLVEVTLALGVAGFALLSIFGLLPIGVSASQTSVEQTTATNIATAVIADLQNTPTASVLEGTSSAQTGLKSPKYGISFPAAASTSTATIYLDQSGGLQASAANSRYKATLTFTAPPAGQRTATYGSLKIGWPAAAATPLGAVTAYVALDRN